MRILLTLLLTFSSLAANAQFSPIDRIFIISSNDALWNRVQNHFEMRGLSVERIPALDLTTLTPQHIRALAGPYPIRLKHHEYATIVNTLSIINDALDKGYSCIWICSDDVEFFDDFKKLPRLLQTLTKYDPNWDIFFTDVSPRCLSDGRITHLYSSTHDPRPDQTIESPAYYYKKFHVSDDLMQVRQHLGTHSFILSRSGMEKIVAYFNSHHLFAPLDVDLQYIPDIHQYSVRADIVSNWASSPIDTSLFDSPPSQPDDPLNDALNQTLFAQAQTHLQNDDFEKALETYQERAKLGGNDEEVFWSLYQIARIQQHLKSDPDIFIESYNKAYHYLPTRQEPLYRLSQHYRLTGEYNLAHLVAKFGASLKTPEKPTYLEEWIYQWGMYMEYSLAAYYSGHYDEFTYASNKMLDDPTLPDYVRKSVVDNLKLVNLILPPSGG